MSAVWYYADRATKHGPMTLAELSAALSAVSAPRETLVWRPGFESWQRAGDVSELAGASGPPPFPPPPPTSDLASGAASDAKLKGIGGWLILVAIGQVLAPVKLFISIAQYYGTLDRELIEKFPLAFAGEGLLNLALVVLCVSTAILFFRKSRRFRAFFVYEIVASAIFLPIDALWVAATIGTATGRSLAELLPTLFEPKEMAQIIVVVIVGGLWIIYLFNSRRVANTFVN
jgi:uncharacterized protein DUF2569/uncharacterized protein DUF4339